MESPVKISSEPFSVHKPFLGDHVNPSRSSTEQMWKSGMSKKDRQKMYASTTAHRPVDIIELSSNTKRRRRVKINCKHVDPLTQPFVEPGSSVHKQVVLLRPARVAREDASWWVLFDCRNNSPTNTCRSPNSVQGSTWDWVLVPVLYASVIWGHDDNSVVPHSMECKSKFHGRTHLVFNFAWRKGLAIHMQIIKHKSQTWIKSWTLTNADDKGSKNVVSNCRFEYHNVTRS